MTSADTVLGLRSIATWIIEAVVFQPINGG